MLVLLSPTKSQQLESSIYNTLSTPPFIEESANIIKRVQDYSKEQIKEVMKVSDKIALETLESFGEWGDSSSKSVDALSIYTGPSFKVFDPQSLTKEQRLSVKRGLIILSGLYGVLHADSSTQRYRLEMGLKDKVIEDKTLKQFWKSRVTAYLNRYAKECQIETVINLASKEYSQVVIEKELTPTMLTIDFRELRDGKLKSISSYAKSARGAMARYILSNNLTQVEDIKKFNQLNYSFSQKNSTDNSWLFVR